MRLVVCLCLILSFSIMGCAGPMTPFGAINGFGTKAQSIVAGMLSGAPDSRIRFSPHRQYLHGANNFSVIIEDPLGVPDSAHIKVVYNGVDVSHSFLNSAQRRYLDSSHRRLELTTHNFRLLPDRENLVYVLYRRDNDAEEVITQYQPPSCSAFETVREVASIPEFEVSQGLVKSINRFSSERQFNPYYLAGLIAQESSFDPRALSRSKALGLTQITALGESEVIKRMPNWPRHPEVNEMSFPLLRLAILRGTVNASNEWRLNPELSVRGGVEYLSYISEYWNKPEKRRQVEINLGDSDLVLSEVMLASYNSGPARVSDALARRGSDWLQDDQLREARKYVRRVNSFCDHFRGEQ